MWTPMGGLVARPQVQKMKELARAEEEEGKVKGLREPVVRAKVLKIAVIGLVNIVPMPTPSLPPDVRCATSSAGEICER
ncbi:hypothetical protein CJ030_MR5G003605 [Morella rubra]|uniref:Uncharacterized protein n=1 Tax=Morella rubra TaxID=262757 RepID=A0A6A1VL65_9ROSI|nr:hypothetical protein CJ030_MR5G003605 [Morella rubra]